MTARRESRKLASLTWRWRGRGGAEAGGVAGEPQPTSGGGGWRARGGRRGCTGGTGLWAARYGRRCCSGRRQRCGERASGFGGKVWYASISRDFLPLSGGPGLSVCYARGRPCAAVGRAVAQPSSLLMRAVVGSHLRVALGNPPPLQLALRHITFVPIRAKGVKKLASLRREWTIWGEPSRPACKCARRPCRRRGKRVKKNGVLSPVCSVNSGIPVQIRIR